MDKCDATCCDFAKSGIILGNIAEGDFRALFGLTAEETITSERVGCLVIDTHLSLEEYEEIILRGKEHVILCQDGTYLPIISVCPSLKDGICLIHDSPERPELCSKYPIDIDEKEGVFGLHIKYTCPAMHELDLSQLISRSREIGLEVIAHSLQHNTG
ncbi:hypothetical protein ACFL6S_01260 [Candidatus Poribacteria bacterium]